MNDPAPSLDLDGYFLLKPEPILAVLLKRPSFTGAFRLTMKSIPPTPNIPSLEMKLEPWTIPAGVQKYNRHLILQTPILAVLFTIASMMASVSKSLAQYRKPFAIIGYYSGNATDAREINPSQLTHVIYSFCGLKGNRLYLRDTATVRALVALKKRNPALKVQLALGGWGGCETCSYVFSAATDREAFASSVLKACKKLAVDGIDLDWEYPSVKGYPGHPFKEQDRENFTRLVQQLRKTLGSRYEISFAAGAFNEYLQKSIDWPAVMKEVDRVNLMSYDLVNGYSPITGHHTALYSTPDLKESIDNAVTYLIKKGIPTAKIIIGAAFYARVWQNAESTNNGLYQPAKPKATIGIKAIDANYTVKQGYEQFWDDVAKAPYRYHPQKKIFVTYDNAKSVQLKTEYMKQKSLGGIMFWQIRLDKQNESLLGVINDSLH